MSDKRKGIERRRLLREKAEDMLEKMAPTEPTTKATEMLMHELMVHRVELEMQNEELQRAITAMEESRDRYVNFYEFAPIGFITLSADGVISEINLTGCIMLGIERFRIISRGFSHYVAHTHKNRWHSMFMDIMEQADNEKQAFDLHMIRADGTLFPVYLNCIKWQVSQSPKELRITLTDISNTSLPPVNTLLS